MENSKVSILTSDALDQIIARKEHYFELKKLMPYNDKIAWANKKIEEFLNACMQHNKNQKNKKIAEIVISFSGGKDSTVLLDLVLKAHKKIGCKIYLIPAYAAEITFPSTFKFIRDTCINYQKVYPFLKNALIIPPKMPWNDILEMKGYPIYSKQISVLLNRIKNTKTKNNLTKYFFHIEPEKYHTSRFKISYNRLFLLDDHLRMQWPKISKEHKAYFKKYNQYYFFSEKCCDFVKGGLKHDKRPCFIGVMAEESEFRKRSWINYGCNIFNKNKMISRPLSLWNSKDIWRYIKENKITVNEAYGYNPNNDLDEQKLRFNRLGCTSCPLGSHMEEKIKLLSNNKGNKNIILNRFEKLFEWFPSLYQTQVIDTGMYKVLIDMNISINIDTKYRSLLELRKKQINDWYNPKNFARNIIRVMCQVENYQNYKNKKYKDEKLNKSGWMYTKKDFLESLNFFKCKNIQNLDTLITLARIEAKELYQKTHVNNF